MRNTYGYPSAMRYPRTMRQSGTELANSIEHHKRSDTSGITIVLVLGVVVACAIVGTWIGGLL